MNPKECGNMNISKDISEKIEKYGWSPERKIDTTEIIKALKEEGYHISEYALKVIEQFGNLELEQPAFRVKNETEKIHLNPLRASTRIYRDRVSEYEERTDESLVVIGEAYNGHLTLMVSSSGKVYGGYDNYLNRLGNSFEEALESIYYSKEAEEIN